SQTTGRANPQGTAGAGGQCHNRVRWQLSLIPVENRKLIAVKTGQALIRAQPQIAITRLGDGTNCILRKALFLSPESDRILSERFAGIQRGSAIKLAKRQQ